MMFGILCVCLEVVSVCMRVVSRVWHLRRTAGATRPGWYQIKSLKGWEQ